MFDLTLEQINQLFEYADGNLVWKKHRNKSRIGTIAGSICTDNYKQVVINGKYIMVHKIVYFMHHGVMPFMIDHIDGDSLNNDITNLREATYSQNNRNAKLRKDNRSGSKGLRLCSNGKWQVYVRVNGKQKSFGVYDDFELADFVGVEVRNKYHREFARHK